VFVAFLAAFIVSQILGVIVLLVMVLRNHSDLTSADSFVTAINQLFSRPGVLLSLGLITQFVLLLTAVGAAIVSPVPFVKRLRLNRSTLPLTGYPLVLLGGMSIGVLYGQVIEFFHFQSNGVLKLLDDILRNLTGWQIVIAVLVLGVLPGFAEEWLFRGYMQTRLKQAWGRWPAILITAILFGVMHLDLFQSPFAMLFGIYLGYVAEKSGSIRPTMLCHMVNNSFQVLIATLVVGRQLDLPKWVELGLPVSCLILLPMAIVYLHLGVKPPPEPQENLSPALGFPLPMLPLPEPV
jgi:membrane protease YdiL (CAAX protease family)